MPSRRDAAANQPMLLRSDEGAVATLTLNRPDARNALSQALMERMLEELRLIAGDPSVCVVVVAGAGPAVTRLPQPTIARVHGVATAAGCQLVASCDLAVAAASAKFATPGVDIGLFCSTPMVPVSRKIGRKPLMEMLLLGEPIGAEEAQRLGLVNRCVPDAALDRTVAEIAAKLLAKSALTLRMGKEAFYRQLDMDLESAYAYCSEVMTRNMMAEDAREGIDAFLEKRPPRWRDR